MDNVKFNLHVHVDMSGVLFGQFVLLVLLTLLSGEWKLIKKQNKKNPTLFYIVAFFSIPRIPNNLCERAIGMLDAGMSTEHVARHVVCLVERYEIFP